MIKDKQVENFIKSINKNAVLKVNYFYPYKPALIISIFSSLSTKQLFNTPIDLNNNEILKQYYDLLTSDVSLFEMLSSHKSKKDWKLELGFNETIKENLLKNIIEMPANKLIQEDNNFWFLNKKDKSITINTNPNYSLEDLNNIKNHILDESYKIFKKCVPSYNNLSNSQVHCFDEVVISNIYENSIFVEVQVRQFQHTFAKKVKDRDKRCLICCESLPELLEAAHIKSYSECTNNLEKYDENNGITLCANHHKLFDNNLFTFNNDWTVKLSNKLKITDHYLRFKEFEKCYSILKQTKIENINRFLNYRNKHHPIN